MLTVQLDNNVIFKDNSIHPCSLQACFILLHLNSVQAYKALDQLHHTDPGERTESLLLSYLEPDLDKLCEGVKSPVSTLNILTVMVLEGKYM